VDTKADEARYAAREAFSQAVDRYDTLLQDPAATQKALRAAEMDKLRALNAYNEARGVTDRAASTANYLTPLTELAEKGQDALHDANRGARTAVADALTSAGVPSVLVGAVTLPSHVFDSVVDFDAGFAKGVVQLADGLAGTVAHPVQTVQGVAGLIDRAAQATPEGRGLEVLFEAAYGKYDTPEQLLAALQDRTNPLSVAKAQLDLAVDIGRGMFAESIRLARQGKYSEAAGTALGQNVDMLFGAGMVGRGGELRAAVEAAEEAGAAGRTSAEVARAAETGARAADAAGDAAKVGRGLEADARATTAAADTRELIAGATAGAEGTPAAVAADKIAPGRTGRLQPGSPEHKVQRWAEYQARNGELTYERWSRVYERNMTRATEANAVVAAYHQRLGWGTREATIDVEGVPRRLDIADAATRRAREVKSGYQSLTQEIQWEILRDQILREKGWDLRWHFEGYATPQLRSALEKAGIPFTGGTN
jgi:hypothetical protein